MTTSLVLERREFTSSNRVPIAKGRKSDQFSPEVSRANRASSAFVARRHRPKVLRQPAQEDPRDLVGSQNVCGGRQNVAGGRQSSLRRVETSFPVQDALEQDVQVLGVLVQNARQFRGAFSGGKPGASAPRSDGRGDGHG